MKLLSRRSLVAAAVVAAIVPLGAASAQNSTPATAGNPKFRALVFTKTAAFRHTDCISQGTAAIGQLGGREHFEVDATENANQFTDANLAGYDVVIFLCTTGDVLNDSQQAAFERYIEAGHGYVGIHSASDTEYDWAWYGGLVGAYFRDHPGVAGVNQQFQTATVNVEDTKSEATNEQEDRTHDPASTQR